MRNWYLLGWVFVLTIGEFQFGYAMGELNLLSDVMPCIYKLNHIDHMIGWAAAMVPAGAAVGAFLAGILSYYGRRTTILIANGFVILGGGLCLGQSIYLLIIGRLIKGFAIGIFSVITPIFIQEIAPTDLKGSYGAMNQLAIVVGIMFSYLMG